MSQVICKISPEIEKTTVMDFSFFPSNHYSTLTVEPYNALLSHAEMEDCVSCFVVMDNEALLNICYGVMGVRDTTYTDVNKDAAKVYYYGGCVTNFQSVHFIYGDFQPLIWLWHFNVIVAESCMNCYHRNRFF